jgi:large subunit ribosomal protein L29
MLTIKEIRDLDSTALEKKIEEVRVKIFTYRMKMTTSGLEKPHLLKIGKKAIARLLTVKKEKKEKKGK